MPLLRGDGAGWGILFRSHGDPERRREGRCVKEAKASGRRLGAAQSAWEGDKSSLGRGDTKRRTTESFSVRSAVFKGRAPKPAVRCDKKLVSYRPLARIS